MSNRSEEVFEVHAVLNFTRQERQALTELGQRLALEGDPSVTGVSDQTALELAINFIVGANLWEARQALDLPGEPHE